MKQMDSENFVFWGLLVIPLICTICLSGLCARQNMENRAQRKRIEALERYIVEHTDQVNIEVIELLRNIEEEN